MFDGQFYPFQPIQFMAGLLNPPMGVGASAVELTYIGYNQDTSNASSYNLGNFNAPSAGLMIVAAFGNVELSRTFSSISIGGSNGTIHASADHSPSGSNFPRTAIASRVVSAGNQNVTVNFTGSQYHCGAWVWLLTGYQSATPNDTDVAPAGAATSRNITLDILPGGCAIYIASHANDDAHSWSSATRRGTDNSIESMAQYTAADRIIAGAGHVETVSWSASTQQACCGAAWR